jgi:ATP-binding cassette, subfamily B, bacterial HlyB/CyaB
MSAKVNRQSDVPNREDDAIWNFPYIAQIDGSDCGAACLCMVGRYLGMDIVLSEARQICGTDVSGQEICSAAEELGFEAQFLRKSFQDVMTQPFPFIAHWEGAHWVVITGQKGNKVKISDPAAGVYTLPYDEAEQRYSGYVCKIDGHLETKQRVSRNNELLKCLVPFRRVIIPLSFLMFFTLAAEMCIPYLLQRVCDENLLADQSSFEWLVFFTLVVSVCVFLGQMFQSWLLHIGALRSEELILERLLNKWLFLPESFFKGRSFNELRVRLESIFKIKKYLIGIGGKGLFALMELIAIFALLEYYESALFFAFLFVPSLALTAYSYYLTRHYTGIFKLSRDSFLCDIDDMTRGVFSIRESSAENYFLNRQKISQSKMYSLSQEARRKIALCEKVATAAGLIACLILFFKTSGDYSNSEISAGFFAAVIVLVGLAFNTLVRIISQREYFADGAIIYDYLNDVFDARVEAREDVPPILKESVSWKVQSFTEEKELSIFLKLGESLFIAGDSRGKALQDFVSQQTPAAISRIEQNSHVFSMTLAENISLGVQLDSNRVRWCLRLAFAGHLEERFGLEKQLGKVDLTEDDVMKIVLARCFYRDRAVYVLEDLSHFLSSKEIQVFNYHMKFHMKDKTIIITDDNLTLAEGATKVVLFNQDKLIEQGDYLELLNRDTVFSTMVNL